MSDSVVVAEEISVAFSETQILSEVSFSLGAGEVLGIIGPNGAGKSTLLRALRGLVAYSGSLRILSNEIRDLPALSRSKIVAAINLIEGLEFPYTVEDLFLFSKQTAKGDLRSISSASSIVKEEILSRLSVEENSGRLLSCLSSGELQKVMIAASILRDTPILLCDEPASHLDPKFEVEFWAIIRMLASLGKSIVVVSHDLTTTTRYTNKILALKSGKLAFFGLSQQAVAEKVFDELYEIQFNYLEMADRGVIVIPEERH